MPKRVLVVEDDEGLRYFYRTALTVAGFHVEEAEDGVQALRSIDTRPPDLVVLDLRLPLLCGVAVRQELAANVLTRQIPIVVVSGSPEDLRGLNVNCVLKKPVSAEQLVKAVRECLANRSA